MINKNETLKKYFGYDSFRNNQEEIIDNILNGRDVLCVMPTGAGKSICYQIPALMFEGITIVVSPLIALMKDQVGALVEAGIPAAYLNSSLSAGQYGEVLQRMYRGEYKIVYVAPERLLTRDFLDLCRSVEISFVAIDEAHCISHWGQDFRPSYLKIVDFISALEQRPTVGAFTATATADVKEDIAAILNLNDPYNVTAGFDRANLKLIVEKPASRSRRVLELVEERAGKNGIIYCSTRKNVEAVQEMLADRGISATRYHAGLSDDERKQNQEDFVFDRKNVIVATNAFGMGIDKSDVSYVIHYNMPKNIEAYYQEAGRAGRDGEPADCILLYSAQDVRTNKYLISVSGDNPDLSEEEQEDIRARDLERLKLMTFYATSTDCLRAQILKYFGETAGGYCGNCSNCLANYETVDISEDAYKIIRCIYQVRQRFGITLITQILKGSRNERILKLGFDKIGSYGAMADCAAAKIRDMIHALIEMKIIDSTGLEYPVLTLNDTSLKVASEKLPVKMKIIRDEKRKNGGRAAAGKDGRAGTRSSADSRGASAAGGHIDSELLDKLKAKRLELARKSRLPAYCIFTNAALNDMCRRLPQTTEEFLDVSGVGEAKLKKYGGQFLEIIAEHADSEKADES